MPPTASHSLGEVLGLGGSPRERFTPRSTGWAANRTSSRPLWHGAICGTASCCSMTSPRPICRDAAANWRATATVADHRRDRPQLVIGLLCAADSAPVAVEVFEGNTADPMTLSAQIDKLKRRFKLHRVVMVGDRGLLTEARITETLRPAGAWIGSPRCAHPPRSDPSPARDPRPGLLTFRRGLS